jgi:hypothetical protein
MIKSVAMRAERQALRCRLTAAGRRVVSAVGKVAVLCWIDEINASTSGEDSSEAFALPYPLVILIRRVLLTVS